MAPPALKTLARTARRRFTRLRAACEARVVRRDVATWNLWSFEPSWFERHQFGRGRRLARKPAATKDCVEYGWDGAGIPARIRDWSGFLRKWHEEELIVPVDARATDLYRFRADGEELLNLHRYHFDRDGRPTLHECLFVERGRIGRERFVWRDGLLREVKTTNWGGDRAHQLEYDDAGLLQRVLLVGDTGRTEVYRRPPRGEQLRDLLDVIAERLVVAVPRAAARLRAREPAYALALVLDDEEPRYFLPPAIAIGLASERARFRAEQGRAAKQWLWSPAELASFDLDKLVLRDAALARACTAANRHIWQRERFRAATKMLEGVVARLQQVRWRDHLPVTDDFLVYLTALDDRHAAAARRAAPPALRKRLTAAGDL